MTMVLRGLDDVVDRLRRLPASMATRSAYEEIASEFSARLRAATPPGYTKKLQDSVIFSVTDESAEVGYDEGVETAGRPELDSVTRPRTRGRSVLRQWTKAEDLQTVLEETAASYSPVSVIARRALDGIS
jgi:hypothetical protein